MLSTRDISYGRAFPFGNRHRCCQGNGFLLALAQTTSLPSSLYSHPRTLPPQGSITRCVALSTSFQPLQWLCTRFWGAYALSTLSQANIIPPLHLLHALTSHHSETNTDPEQPSSLQKHSPTAPASIGAFTYPAGQSFPRTRSFLHFLPIECSTCFT